MVFEVMQKLQEGELDADSMPGVVSQLKSLALVAQRVERASQVREKREREIRERAADRAERSGRAQGLSAEGAAEIRREILGVE